VASDSEGMPLDKWCGRKGIIPSAHICIFHFASACLQSAWARRLRYLFRSVGSVTIVFALCSVDYFPNYRVNHLPPTTFGAGISAVARLNRAVRPEGGQLTIELFHRFSAIALRAACPSASRDSSRDAKAAKVQ
jgi:hypothetical protein